MKKMVLFVLMFLFVAVFINYGEVDAKQTVKLKVGKEGARIGLLDGPCQTMSPGEMVWRPLRQKDILRPGDEVLTGAKTRLELVLPDNTKVRFADNTRFILQQADFGSEEQGRNVKVHVVIGKIWAKVTKSISRKSRFEISCETAIAGVRGTVYRLNVSEDRSALVKVYDGRVEVSGWTGRAIAPAKSGMIGTPYKVEGPKTVAGPKKVSMQEWTYIIKSMQQIRIKGDGTAEKPEDFDEKEDLDDWVRWNKMRDSKKDNEK